MDKLAVIIPVYNEEEIIEEVLADWISELDSLNIDYKIFAYNDGSTDKTGELLENLAKNYPKLVVINQENSWHGPTILKGYKAHSVDFDWIFQVDADNEMSAESFNKMWEKRNEYDLLMVIRKGRTQSFVRKFISFVSRLCIQMFYGESPWDVNSPYRLMRCECFKDLFNKFPENILSPNMALAGAAAKKKFKIYEFSVPCAPRKTGKALGSFKLLKTSITSFWQTILFSFVIK